jgi:hypothetical protein
MNVAASKMRSVFLLLLIWRVNVVSGEVVIDYLGRAVQDVLANASAERGKESLNTHSSKSSFRILNLSFLYVAKYLLKSGGRRGIK